MNIRVIFVCNECGEKEEFDSDEFDNVLNSEVVCEECEIGVMKLDADDYYEKMAWLRKSKQC